MRIGALLWGILAVTVWWGPLSKPFQSLLLVTLAVTFLALHSAWKRLDRVHEAVTEVQETMRTIRVAAAASKGQDPEDSP